MNNARVEPSSPNLHPSAPPMYPTVPPPPHYNASPQPLTNTSINVPPLMYSVPLTTQPQLIVPPPGALKPIPHPPPAPALNEVLLSEDRQRVRCPYCGTSITTIIHFRTGMMTHIAAFALFFTCCPLAFLPYCIDICKDVDHSCPSCNRNIGRFKRFT